ncbi:MULTISPECIES: phosphatase PAP2 family protein [Micrococcaceae]|uniref:hypothetical protein n=1 Tax=unclassified Kocuria TaxID=2649579 RepID=UPI001011D128|nr:MULTISPECIES: hypothetical protein [unclassified Kocuria]
MHSLQRAAAFAGTEIFSPFILAAALLIAVPASAGPGWAWQAAVGVVAVVVIPWGLSLYMAHTGQVSDRFIYHRKQRYVFYGLSLISIAAGTTILLVAPAAAATKSIIVVMLLAVLVIALVNFRLKASAHAGMSAVFGMVLPGLLGPWWIILSLIVHATVCWSRWHLRKHTVPEILVGSVIGVILGACHLWFVSSH